MNIESCNIGVFERGVFLVTDSPGDNETERKAAKITGWIHHEWLRDECELFILESGRFLRRRRPGNEGMEEATRFTCPLEDELRRQVFGGEISLLEAITSQPVGRKSVHRIPSMFRVG